MSREEKIIAQAKERFRRCAEAEYAGRQKALDDLRFLAGEQWTPLALAQRARDQRPALVVNRLDQFVQHISNSMRQMRIGAQVFPVDDAADKDTAEIIQGIIRHIENASSASLAYHTAAFYAVSIGFGYWRQITEYCDPLSFDLDVKIERIANPFQVYLGPHTMPDGSDAEYGFVFSDLTREEFEREYPDAKSSGIKDWQSIGDGEGWLGANSIRVAEYYCTEYREDTLVRLADGRTKLKSELSDGDLPALDASGQPIERLTKIPTVRWYKLTALEVLDETVWPIPRVPIIKVTGNELNVDGKTELKGIIRNLKDAQRQYNYMLSAQTEAIDSAKGQVLIAEGQEEGHEEEFRNLSRNQVVRYKPTDLNGQPVPPPTRLAPNMSIAHMTEARLMAADDLKALTGIYDAALGARSNETSGRGILARQQQTDIANFHFQDNLTLSITHSTRMLVDLIGKIYDTPRVVRIIGENDAQKIVRVNQQYLENGQARLYDLTAGRYDVVCSAGPTFKSRRQEAAQMLTQLAASAPILMTAAPDLIIKTYDIPYAEEISDRLARTLPPGLADKPGQEKIPPAVAQQMQQLAQQNELLAKELTARTEQMERKQLEMESAERLKQMELESRERIERARIEAQMFDRQQQTDSAEAIAALQAEIAALKAHLQTDTQVLARNAAQVAQTI